MQKERFLTKKKNQIFVLILLGDDEIEIDEWLTIFQFQLEAKQVCFFC